MSHIEKYLARYTVLFLAVLTPAAALLGQVAADLGGADTAAGRAALGVASGLGVVVGGLVFLQNLGKYQMLRDFGNLWDSFKNYSDKTPAEVPSTTTPPQGGTPG